MEGAAPRGESHALVKSLQKDEVIDSREVGDGCPGGVEESGH